MRRSRPNLSLAAAFAIAAFSLTASSAVADLVLWTGAGNDHQWHTAANWWPHAPGEFDDAVNNTTDQIFLLNGALVKSIHSQGKVQVLGAGLLRLASDSSFDGGLVMYGNTDLIVILNYGVMEVGGEFAFHNGTIQLENSIISRGQLEGVGTLVLKPNCTMTVYPEGTHHLLGGSTINQGTLIVKPNTALTLGMHQDYSSVTNFLNDASGSFYLEQNARVADMTFTLPDGTPINGGNSVFENDGLLSVTDGVSTIESDISFASPGTILLQGATFDPPTSAPGYARTLSRSRRPYATQDGFLAVLPYNDGQWRRFFEAIGKENFFWHMSFQEITALELEPLARRVERASAAGSRWQPADGGSNSPTCARCRPRRCCSRRRRPRSGPTIWRCWLRIRRRRRRGGCSSA